MKIEAATRLMASAQTQVEAAQASVKKAEKFLTEIGFSGLDFKTDKDNAIAFSYEKYDARKVAKFLGQPKANKSESLRYQFGDKGVVAIWPGKKTVWMSNSARNVK